LKLLNCLAAASVLTACASPPRPAAPLTSREDRSREYCHLLAVNSAQESTANRLCLDLEDAAASRARTAELAGLPQAGVLVSSSYASLHPGYLVVFSGVYRTPAEAAAGLADAHSRGFPDAYVARVTH